MNKKAKNLNIKLKQNFCVDPQSNGIDSNNQEIQTFAKIDIAEVKMS